MRMLTTHYSGKAEPAIAKKKRAQIAHVSPPLKGLSEATLTTIGDQQTATILTNFVIENNAIKCRSGYRKLSTHASGMPIWHLIPHYGLTKNMISAVNHTLSRIDTGATLVPGFTSDDWHWTSFANLSQVKYTIMVNGADGVISWNGGFATPGAWDAIVSVSKAADAVVTLNAADIGAYSNGMEVDIQGATGSWAILNGPHAIALVGAPANTFTIGVDTSACTGTVNAGAQVRPAGSMVKENISAPANETWINPDQFNIVLSHQNRLFFADNTSLAVFYLPIQQKSGEVKFLLMNNMFRRGGTIRAMYTWSVDGGAGMDDCLVVFSSNGECVIWKGIDPDSDFEMVGIFRFDSPMSKHSVINYGGDLYVLISTGLVPMSTMIRAEAEQLGQADQNVVTIFRENSFNYRNDLGWQTYLNPSTGRLLCNLPRGAPNRYRQMVRHMPNAIWSMYEDIPARCWNWIEPYTYFGDDSGNVYQMHASYLNDDGRPIRCDLQTAWSDYKTPAKKHFLVIQTYLTSSGLARPIIDMKVNYDLTPGVNQPDVNETTTGAAWDLAVWDQDYWAPGERARTIWNGVCPTDHVGAVRLTALIQDSTFQVNGFDVIYEAGTYGP